MLNFVKNKRIPDEIADTLKNSDCLKIISCKPMLCFFNLSNITDDELNSFSDNLTIYYSFVEGIPYLVFEFNGMSFDTAFFNVEANDKKDNALNLMLVENRGKILKEMRVVGLDYAIMERLIEDTKNLSMSLAEFELRCSSIEARYSSQDLMAESILTQEFNRN